MEKTELELMAKLAKKIQQIMETVTHLPKTGYNDHFKYKFVTESDALDAIRTRCVEVGMIILPSVLSSTFENGKTRIVSQYTYIDVDTGYAHSVTWAGEANDTQDKGISKAIVSSGKYQMLKAFMIPSGDDPDAGGPMQAPKAAKKTKAQLDAENEKAQYDKIIAELGLTEETKAEIKGRTGLAGREFASWLIAQHAGGAKGFKDLLNASSSSPYEAPKQTRPFPEGPDIPELDNLSPDDAFAMMMGEPVDEVTV